MSAFTLLVFGLLASYSTGLPGDLSVAVRANSRVLRVGDTAVFTITYTNNSDHDLGIIPDAHLYEASEIELRNAQSGKLAEVIRYLTLEYDYREAAKSLRVLKPGESYVKQVTGEVSSNLPKHVEAQQAPGLYLLFDNSAIRLPGSGKYEVGTKYAISEYFHNFLQNFEKQRLWLGTVSATPITIEFPGS